ncbi:MAG TPA: hypothetical protein VNF49_01465 [Candidatus Binataceae bacterium]|nr:hypothetical protein [Candidatus Binataceae bacterium]
MILYYAHFCSPAVLREVARLRNELDRRYDIFAAGYCRSAGALGGVDCVPALEYTANGLIALPYPGKVDKFDPASFIGNADLVPMKFFLDRPDYDYYWIIEYDVRFSGAWPELFADLSSSGADLLCTTMQTWAENPNWAHWETLTTGGEDVPLERRVKGFMPFCRLSHALLAACDARYRRGWGGHSEVIWPTVASLAGLSLEDIGGNGSFTPAERRGRYYQNTPSEWSQFPGTFVYRPCFADRNLFGPQCHFAGTLWHPVKE